MRINSRMPMSGKVGLFPVIIVWFLLLLVIMGYLVGLKYNIHILKLPWYIILSLVLVSCFLIILYDRWQPLLPVCKSGKCKKWRDYKFLSSSDVGRIYRCSCGDDYVLIEGPHGERHCMELLDDGITRPYMKHTRFRRWEKDIRE